MKEKFSVYFSCTEDERPPISEKVSNYFSNFIIERILIPKNILLNAKWDVILSLIFVGEGRGGGPDIPFLAKGSRTVKAENKKIYEMLVPLKLLKHTDDPYISTIKLLYQALSIFFISTYKTITPEFMGALWDAVDLEYLLSLPYPAPIADQKYVA